MQNIIQIIIELLLLSGLVAVIFLLLNKKEGKTDSDEVMKMSANVTALREQLSYVSEQNNNLRKEVDAKLSETHKVSQEQFGKTAGMMQEQFGKTAGLMQGINKQTQEAMSMVHRQSQQVIAEVTEKLTKLDETNKQVVNFSSQLQNLQDILKNPKQRGVLGEYFLEETLKNVLPPNSYQMQYAFKNGEIVDAVVFVKEKIIPIDSKFSLENYERVLNSTDADERERYEKLFRADLKTRIDETSKYVRPGENTMDFAFMFIPSESIYYDLLVNKVGAAKINTRDLIDYAFKDRRVIIVSPTSFLAYLQTVLQGLRALQIEESAKMIKHNVEKLGKHLNSYEEFIKKLGNSMGTSVNHYNNAYKEFAKLEKDVVKITDGEASVDPLTLDKPKTD